jgi:hypothetical protein
LLYGTRPSISWFTIDDNSHLADKHLPKFVLELRNETEWSLTDPILRRISKDKGGKTVSAQELLDVLHEAGYITVDEAKSE